MQCIRLTLVSLSLCLGAASVSVGCWNITLHLNLTTMARHRNIRSLNYEEEYNDYFDEYSRSVEDDHCISPRTAQQYLLGDGDEYDGKAHLEKVEEGNENVDSSDLSLIDAKTYSCLEAIQDVVGETIPEEVIVATIKKYNYDTEVALDVLLNRSKPSKPPEGLVQSPEDRLSCLSNLYIALTTRADKTDTNSIDFNNYNFRKYMKDVLLKSVMTYQNSVGSRDLNKPKPAAVANVAKPAPVRNSSKGDLTKLTPNTDKSKKQTNPEKSDKAESPFSTPKFLKNVKSKSSEETLALFAQKRQSGKENLNLVIVGHVDAGKSTIMGHLLSLMGMVSKKSMHKNEVDARKAGKASFMYAWVLDETEEERNRGITIDVGTYRFQTEKRIVTILDAPGHRDFIPNMIDGATKADVAILVVDATKGEFETGFESGGQTQEHTLLLRSLGISQLAVVVNKLDNVNFDKGRYLEIVDKLRKFLKQVGFKDSNVHFVPCSGLTGDNLVHSSTNAAFSWFKGFSLVQVIDTFSPNERPVIKSFRMAINDIFKGQTSGICVSGKIDSGFIETGQKLLIRPANEICTIKNMFNDEESFSEAFAGDVLTLNLLVSEGSELSIGNVLCDISMPCTLASKFEARIVIFSNIESPITKGFSVILYSVCLNEVARISKLCSIIDKSNEVLKKNPRILMKNNNAIVEFTSTRPICVEAYSDFKEYGRFIFRSGNLTVGAGIITKIIS